MTFGRTDTRGRGPRLPRYFGLIFGVVLALPVRVHCGVEARNSSCQFVNSLQVSSDGNAS